MLSERTLIFLAAIIAVFIYQYSTIESTEFNFDLNVIDDIQRDKLFTYLDTNKDKRLTQNEFKVLFKSLFHSTKLKNTYLDENIEAKLLDALNINKEKQLTKEEFDDIWNKWIKIILKPKSALIVVDVQNDFISDDGTMRVEGGKTIVPVINQLIKNANFDTIVYTFDWHPSNHCSFIDSVKDKNIDRKVLKMSKESVLELKKGDTVIYEKYPDVVQHLWPTHCVQNTTGAQLYKDLVVAKNSINVTKGTNPDIDSYSAFWDNGKKGHTELDQMLQKLGITDVYLSGVVYEFCVGFTANDALGLNYRTAFIENAIKELETIHKNEMRTKLINKFSNVIKSDDVLDMVNGRDRRPEMAIVLANKIYNKLNSVNNCKYEKEIIL